MPTPRPDSSLASSRVETPSANSADSQVRRCLGRQAAGPGLHLHRVPVDPAAVVVQRKDQLAAFDRSRELDAPGGRLAGGLSHLGRLDAVISTLSGATP
jgi:hypothetical protein